MVLEGGAQTVVAIGEDGTAHEVVNGFFDRGVPINPHARIAFVAAGTGNDVTRALPSSEASLLAVLRGTASQRVDVLRVRYRSGGANLTERYALTHVDIGLLADAVAIANRFKSRLRRFAYAGGGVLSVVHYRPGTMDYSCNGGPILVNTLHLILVANSVYAGGGMLLAPPASINDGLLDVIALRKVSRLDIVLRIFPAAYRGWHMRHRAIEHTQARLVRITCDDDQRIEIDGELAGKGPVEIEVCPRVLPVCM
ncbi:MAG: diacylglycerol kinase family lipid kinase [Chloroflexota bacterium]